MTDAGPGILSVPAVGVHFFAVDHQSGLEFHRVRGTGTAFFIMGPGDIEPVILVQLDTLIAQLLIVVAIALAAAHTEARKVAAVADAAIIDKAAAGHGKDAVVALGNGACILAVFADMARRAEVELGGVLGDGQNAAGTVSIHLEDQDLVHSVDGKDLLAQLCAHGGSVAADPGLVDINMVVSVGLHVGMIVQIVLHGVPVQLIEKGVEITLVLGQLPQLGVQLIHVDLADPVGIVSIGDEIIQPIIRLDQRDVGIPVVLFILGILGSGDHGLIDRGREHLGDPTVTHGLPGGDNDGLPGVFNEGNL